jgi:G:T-mismatch repair DNA endonuclease (very short patch repair protein)
MIHKEATIKYKGYAPDDLRPHSGNRICMVCDICGRVRWGKKQSYRDLCRTCANRKRNYHHSEETKQSISDMETGKIVSDETKAKQRASRNEFVKNNPDAVRSAGIKSGNALRGRKQSPEVVAAVKERWKDPVYRATRLKQMLQFHTPNTPETRMIDVLKKHNLPYRFVGNGELIIDGFNPDFVNCNGKKVLIEVFGDYWHTRKDWEERDERRFESFLSLGYATIVFWEHELVKSRQVKNSPTLREDEIVSRIAKAERKYMIDNRRH